MYQDGKALLHQQRRVEDDQPKAQWQHIITCPDPEEIANPLLCDVAKSDGQPELGPDRRGCNGHMEGKVTAASSSKD